MQEVLPHMLENGGGTIVNIASMAHKRGGPGTSVHYASAKGAVVTMTLGVAREFADRGIRCLSISPASVDTAFQAASGTSREQAERALSGIPMKRIADADEIGELVLFMCSDACQFMTADTVYVSGGGGYR
jgi:3-oxoacyl-[acyl-carrier protein] reductase